jgi:hypothetical protein
MPSLPATDHGRGNQTHAIELNPLFPGSFRAGFLSGIPPPIAIGCLSLSESVLFTAFQRIQRKTLPVSLPQNNAVVIRPLLKIAQAPWLRPES